MYRTPWANDPIVGTQQPRVQAPTRIRGAPRAPAPRYNDEEESARLRNERLGQEIQAAPLSQEATQIEIDRKRRDLQQTDTQGANFQDEHALRTQFEGLPEVRRYSQSLAPYYGAITAADTRAGDLSLVYGAANILDPGAVVRESDSLLVQRTAALDERLIGAIRTVTGGGELTAETRRALRDELRTRGRVLGEQYGANRRRFSELAQRYGFDPNAIVGAHPEPAVQRSLGIGRDGRPIRQEQQREGDIGFSGRTEGSEVVPFTPEQMRGFSDYMGRQRPGQLRVEDFNREFQQITGRPNYNAEAVVNAFNETGQFAPLNASVFTNLDAQRLNEAMRSVRGAPGSEDLLFHGATLGLTDQAAGVGNVINNAIYSPFTDQEFNPGQAYLTGRDAQNLRLDEARNRSGWLGTGAEFLGGLTSLRPGLSMFGSRAPSLGARVAEGARIGGGTGALAGTGYAEGPPGSFNPGAGIQGAVTGGTLGATVGGAFPLFGAGTRTLNEYLRASGRGSPEVARRVVGRAISDDMNTPRGVAQQMQQAQNNGVPYMLADSGDNARGLLAASTRAPGQARTLARDALEERQAGLAERVQGSVERNLGPASNPHEISDQLMQQAQARAAPLYDAAYARPGADAFYRSVQGMLGRPSMQRAMARASRIAQEEGRDPRTVGFNLDAEGNVTIDRVPSWQTMDYLKRGMDDVVETYRDRTSGRLQLDTEGRAINNTLRSFLNRFDQANPDYAQARAAYAGPNQANDAMERGLRAIDMTADDLSHATQRMSAGEQQFFALGLRRAMVERVARTGDTGDAVRALIGNQRKRGMLMRVFGGRRGFDNFIETVRAEQEGWRTFQRATQGSPTAQNLQDDAALNAGTVVTDIALGAPITTATRIASRMLGNRASDQTRQEVAAILSETDPARLNELARELRREAAIRRRSQHRSIGAARGAGRAAGQVGAMIGPPDLF